jgi:hypothetical protein
VPDPRYGPWQPFELDQVRALFDAQPAPWWIAGGRALELFAGRRWRAHGDLDVGILRRDEARVIPALRGFERHAAHGDLQLLAPGALAPDAAHCVWCRAHGRDPWRFELLLTESEGDAWVFRREPGVQRPLAELVRTSAEGLPYLRPEVQLLYKAKDVRPKDELDLAEVAPLLDTESRHWLRAALARTHPDHAWLDRLARAPDP